MVKIEVTWLTESEGVMDTRIYDFGSEDYLALVENKLADVIGLYADAHHISMSVLEPGDLVD